MDYLRLRKERVDGRRPFRLETGPFGPWLSAGQHPVKPVNFLLIELADTEASGARINSFASLHVPGLECPFPMSPAR